MAHRKYFVTKWFITNGIMEAPGIPNEDSDYISVKIPGKRFSNSIRLGTDVFERRVEAENRGKILLRNEIANTEKYLRRLNKKLNELEANTVGKDFGVYQSGPGETDGWVLDGKSATWRGTQEEAVAHAAKLTKKFPFPNPHTYAAGKLPVDILEEMQKEASDGT